MDPNDAKYILMDDLYPRKKNLDHDINSWKKIDNEQYDNLFEGSAIRRAKFEKFKMNTGVVANNLAADPPAGGHV